MFIRKGELTMKFWNVARDIYLNPINIAILNRLVVT